MNIEKLEIKGFGKLDGLVLEFDRGLNIVTGENEAGKSTVQAFIKAMFYGMKGGRQEKSGMLPELKRYKPWKSPEYGGALEYRLQNGEFFRIERNFEENTVRVFDALFNEVTNSFGFGKDKGIKLGEKHLGINEACFERTVFVRQRDTVIKDGQKELLNRLSNINETGFDDVSFKKAEEALKEALKRYVGTDRTSTRPLDRINTRIDELKAYRAELLERRRSVFEKEELLRSKLEELEGLRAEKQFLDEVRGINDINAGVSEVYKQLEEITRLRSKAANLERQIEELSGEASGAMVQREKLNAFSCFEYEDVEALNRDYSTFKALEEQRAKLENRISGLNAQLEEERGRIEAAEVFRSLPPNVENKISSLNREIEELRRKCNEGVPEEWEGKIKQCTQALWGARALAMLFLAAALVFAAVGLSGKSFGYGFGALFFVLVSAAAYFASGKSKERNRLRNKKNAFLKGLDSFLQELQVKDKELSDIYEKAGVSGYEGFVRLKVSYDAQVKASGTLGSQLEYFQSEKFSIDRKIYGAKNSMLEKLFTAEVIKEYSDIIDEVHIAEFTKGFYRYKELGEKLEYINKKCKDINLSLEEVFIAASRAAQKECRSIPDIDIAQAALEKMLEDGTTEAKDRRRQLGRAGEELEAAAGGRIGEGEALQERSNKLNESYEELCGKINERLLEIREIQTLIKTLQADNESLQNIEEEMASLKERKKELELSGGALKLALETLTEASREIQRDYAPALNKRMGEVISHMTGGRYGTLRADGDLVLKAIAPETGDIAAASILSGGTADQMYLAMRITLADMISLPSEKLPLILDEVFSQYDDRRTKDTLCFLRSLSPGRQVLLMTCKSREVEIAAGLKEDINIINL